MIALRPVQDGDLPVFWEYMSDTEAQQMAAFTRPYNYDRELFDSHWAMVRGNPEVLARTVVDGTTIAGHVSAYGPPEERGVTYWIGRHLWGRGIATRALAALLELDGTRPMYANAAADNTGSIRVLEKCGFVVTGHDRGFAQARDGEIDEVALKLG